MIFRPRISSSVIDCINFSLLCYCIVKLYSHLSFLFQYEFPPLWPGREDALSGKRLTLPKAIITILRRAKVTTKFAKILWAQREVRIFLVFIYFDKMIIYNLEDLTQSKRTYNKRVLIRSKNQGNTSSLNYYYKRENDFSDR